MKQTCGIRGAVNVEANTKEAIGHAAQQIITEIMTRNRLDTESIISVLFTATPDITADFPARWVRKLGPGWQHIPLLCNTEMDVEGAMKSVLRVLVLCEASRAAVRHVYLGETAQLRPDLTS